MNTSSTIWGADALAFLPSRWLRPDGSFFQPPRASFLPWSAGPRNCPGQKMAEVEFVAVMMSIFRGYKVAPLVGRGESFAMAAERLEGCDGGFAAEDYAADEQAEGCEVEVGGEGDGCVNVE